MPIYRLMCRACGTDYETLLKYSDLEGRTCELCGGPEEQGITLPADTNAQVARSIHGHGVTHSGKVLLTDKKSEAITRAQWEARKNIDAAKKKGDKEAVAEASVALEGYKREALKDIGKDKPAQSAIYNGSKVQ